MNGINSESPEGTARGIYIPGNRTRSLGQLIDDLVVAQKALKSRLGSNDAARAWQQEQRTRQKDIQEFDDVLAAARALIKEHLGTWEGRQG